MQKRMRDPERIDHGVLIGKSRIALGCGSHQLDGFDVLTDGASGACCYRLHVSPNAQFLKVTRATARQHLLDGAYREVMFYKHLASEVAIGVPRKIASCRDQQTVVCLLLEACESILDVQHWAEAQYIEVSDLLGRLHAAFWKKTDSLAAFAWLRRGSEPDQRTLRKSVGHWQRLRAIPRFEDILTSQRYVEVLDMVTDLEMGRLAPFTSALPLTLCHGDFHSGNILRNRHGDLVVVDWQDVGVGHGPEDLSFFMQRASFAGGSVPRDAMAEAYRTSLSTHVGEEVSMQDIRRCMDASELRTRLLHWPAFLAQGSEQQLSELLERIFMLRSRLLA